MNIYNEETVEHSLWKRAAKEKKSTLYVNSKVSSRVCISGYEVLYDVV